MAKVADVADAVVTLLQANGFSEAARRYLPYHTVKDLADRQTSVIPKLDTLDDGARSGGDRVFDLSITVAQQVDPADNDAVDSLTDNVETLIEACDEGGFLREATPASTTWLEGPEFPRGVLYDPKLLDDKRVFLSAMTVRYELLEE